MKINIKPRIKDALASAVSWITLMYGIVLAGMSLLIGYMAWAGSVPAWHPIALLAASMISLGVSSYLS